jgi:hypothetical protein
MKRRAAATLVEVLVAIFVMGIGLIALLTLFPIGIISMAGAIRDEKCYQCSVIANSIATALDVRHDPWVILDWDINKTSFAAFGGTGPPTFPPNYTHTGNIGGKDPPIVIDAYTNPNPLPSSAPFTPIHLPPADPNGPSYPLLIDPVGYYTSALSPNWVGGQVGVLARRRTSFTRTAPAMTPSPPYLPGTVPPVAPPGWNLATPPQVPQYPQPYPYPPPPPSITTQTLLPESIVGTFFTLTDDLVYDGANPGVAAATPPPPPTTLFRNTNFSWAYVVQRPANGSPAIVNMSVVVFNKRPLSLGGSLSLPEYCYNYNPGFPAPALPPLPLPGATNTTYFDPANNIITIDYTDNVPPPIRPGDWIMDVTMGWTINQTSLQRNLVVGPPYSITGTFTPHGTFYRVVSVNELQDSINLAPRSLVQFETQTPLRGFTDNSGSVVFPVYNAPTPTWSAIPIPGVTATGTPGPTITDNGVTLGYAGSSVVFDGVARVFEMGAGRTR